jgi:hypothetical protein
MTEPTLQTLEVNSLRMQVAMHDLDAIDRFLDIIEDRRTEILLARSKMTP